MNPKELARWGEDTAQTYLEVQGLKILARNYRCPRGEVDMVALGGDVLIFVEVKTRRSMKYGLPQESIGPWKERRLLHTAHWYLAEQGIAEDCYIIRFDLLTIYCLAGSHHISWLQDIIKII